MSGLWNYVHFLFTQYLMGPPSLWIIATMQCDMEVISLWLCVGLMEPGFDGPPLGHRRCWILCLIFLFTSAHTFSRFSVGFRSGEFVGQLRLDPRNAKPMSGIRLCSALHALQLQSIPPNSRMKFSWQSSEGCSFPYCCCTFCSPLFSLPHNFLIF